MPTWFIILLVVLIAITVGLIIAGRRLQKKQDEGQAQIEAAKQVVPMLIIDKKKMKVKEAGLPKMVTDQFPWYLKGRKMPIIKAKIGPKIMSFLADPKVYDKCPVKAQVKAEIAGIYITDIKGVRGGKVSEEPAKKGFFSRFKKK